MFNSYLNSTWQGAQRRMTLGKDLAWRWFNAESVKRDRIPLIPEGFAKPLTDYATYEEFYSDYMLNNLIIFSYQFKTLDGTETWDVYSPNAEIEYGKWYDWFQGTTPSQGGGGGGGAELAQTMILNNRFGYKNSSSNTYPGDSLEGTTTTANIPASTLTSLEEKIENKEWLLGYYRFRGYNNSTNYYALVLTTSDTPISVSVQSSQTMHSVNTYYEVTITGTNLQHYRIGIENPQWNGLNINLTVKTTVNDGLPSGFSNNNQTTSVFVPYAIIMYDNLGNGTSVPTPEPEPVYPPDVEPEPVTPTADPTQPTNPQITISAPTTISNETTTTTADLTPILQAIRILNENVVTALNTLHNDIANCCETMRDFLQGWFVYLGTLLEQVRGYLYDWLEKIWRELRIANQWLEGIFWKSPGGTGSQPDMASQGDDWWEWLLGIATALIGNLGPAVSQLAGAADGLHTLFPFSIPWDVAAMLALLVAEPVTPVFVIPWGYASNATANITIDLTPYDGVMQAVRSVELLIFAAGLAFKTRDLLRGSEIG